MTDDDRTTSWRDQLIELDLPGVGSITASADPALWAEPETAAGSGRVRDCTRDPDRDRAPECGPEREAEAFRRREPTSPPDPARVRQTLRGRVPLDLAHTWLVVPALGPVLPTLSPEGTTIADLSGQESPFEVRPARDEAPPRPSQEGVLAGAPRPGTPAKGRRGPVRPPQHSWFRRPALAEELRRRGGPVALGALVGPRRDWFEPAVAVREDLLAVHPDQALESAMTVAVDHGQAAVLRLGPRGLDVVPTGADPRIEELQGQSLLVTARPAQCPLQGEDGCGPCRPVGGPWIRASHAAQVDWEARRSQALAVQECGVCFGEALPPEPDQPPVPRLGRRTPVVRISRLHLRGGEVVRIDPIAPPS
ncbi:hypothetical protein [Brachybacterium sp.]|uniref:hypothetical protein n=1 Tax=Brachybacterium sp. TaxID=1891286 RepID=UPI002ED17F14